jgi:hypothetical protein
MVTSSVTISTSVKVKSDISPQAGLDSFSEHLAFRYRTPAMMSAINQPEAVVVWMPSLDTGS